MFHQKVNNLQKLKHLLFSRFGIALIPSYGEQVNSLTGLVVKIHFNRDIDPTIQEDFVLDQRGASDPDGNPIEIKGRLSWLDSKTLQFKAEESLKPSSTYQVNLFSVRTPEGEEMEEVPYRLVFTTADTKVK